MSSGRRTSSRLRLPYRDRVTWMRDAAPVLALGLAGVAEAVAGFGADAARLTLALALALPLLVRRKHPAAALLGVTTAFVVQLPWQSARLFDATFVGFVCLLWGSYAVGRHASGTWSYLVAGGAALSGGLVIGWADQSVSSGVLGIVILAAPAWVGYSVREHVTARATLAAQAAELADSLVAAGAARALEARAQVAAEIQTALAARVGSILDATHRARALVTTRPRDAVVLVAGVEAAGREALADMRRTLGVLRDAETAPSTRPPWDDRGVQSEPASLGRWLPAGLIAVSAWEATMLGRDAGARAMVVAALLAVLMAAPTMIRRGRPVLAAALSWTAACALVSQVPVPISVVLVGMLLAGSAGVVSGGWHRVAGLVVALVGVAAVTITGGFSGVGDYLFPALLVTLAWLGGAAMRHQAVLDAEVEARTNEVRSVREVRAAAAATQERLRLARELHDVVAHHVMVMVVQAGAARRTVESGRDGADAALASVASTGDAVLEELAQLLALVDPGTRERGEGHGMGKLEELVDRVRAGGLQVDLRVIGDRRSLPGGLDLVAHRIVQESLTNVIRHAGASRARVQVTYLPDRLTLEITDDGRGLGAGPQAGLGVTGMRERAQMYGGRCKLSPSAEGGVRVRATLPLELVGEPV